MNHKPTGEKSIVELAISDSLDLHAFQASDVKELVIEYLFECKKNNIHNGRIIHGKGIGTLREIVHSILKKHPDVESYSLGNNNSGNWGETTFRLTDNKPKHGN